MEIGAASEEKFKIFKGRHCCLLRPFNFSGLEGSSKLLLLYIGELIGTRLNALINVDISRSR